MECKCDKDCKNYGKPGCKCAIKAKEELAKMLESQPE
jgi:predicted metal-binding protein